MKNVNDVDFDTNISRDMCMKVILLFIDIKLRIAIYIIYVHDDVDVSAYEYVNVYVDENGYVYRYLCMHDLENEDWFTRL